MVRTPPNDKAPVRGCLPQLFAECRCRKAVLSAYEGMLRSERSRQQAFEVAVRVYRYHHPEQPRPAAREIVSGWLMPDEARH